MDEKQTRFGWLRELPRRIWRRPAIAGAAILLCGLGAAASFLMPRSAHFSYSQANCVTSPVLLPRLTTIVNSPSFSAKAITTLSLAGYPLYSHRTCLEMISPANSTAHETIRLQAAGLPFMQKEIRVKPEAPPLVSLQAAATKFVSTTAPMLFGTSISDRTFDYTLRAGTATAHCGKLGRQISCDTAQLKLAHATEYTFQLDRGYRGKPAGAAFAQKLATVHPVNVSGSSIKPGQMILDKPGEVTLDLNRAASKAESVRLVHKTAGKVQELPVTYTLKDNRLVVKFGKELPRSATLGLEISSLKAADGGYMSTPYGLEFHTSGGPKVLGASIGTYNVPASSLSNINLRLDAAVVTGQNLNDSVRVESGGKVLGATITGSGNTINVRLQQALPACTGFSIRVLDSLQNSFGVGGGNTWSLQSRTTCQTVFSIGSSVQGRSINAYRFGGGASNLVYVGATHGDERSSAIILQRWVDYLEANPSTVPAHRSVTIIPIFNPDGYAANKRTNANNVDLNRNFPANNWKKSVIMPDKSTNESGGGASPLSEPESKALANYVQAQKPRLVLTYHATGNVVSPNSTDDSDTLARRYATNSSVYYLSPSSTATFFEYDTTGAFEDWLHDKAGIPALLVELNSFGGNEFNGHLPALKITAGL